MKMNPCVPAPLMTVCRSLIHVAFGACHPTSIDALSPNVSVRYTAGKRYAKRNIVSFCRQTNRRMMMMKTATQEPNIERTSRIIYWADCIGRRSGRLWTVVKAVFDEELGVKSSYLVVGMLRQARQTLFRNDT